jgi:Pentapeptide repeats (9 copies)
MTATEIKHLRSRWSDADVLKINKLLTSGQILAEEMGRSDAAPGPFIDLRGFNVTSVVKKVELTHIDLSYGWASEAGQFGLCKIQHCLFIGGEFGTNLGRSFVDCDFTIAKLQRGAFFGEFRDCIFAGANLSNARGNVKFINCSFRGANLKGAHFLNCVFDACDFAECKLGNGSFAFSTIIGVKQSEVEFKDTLLEGVVFR